MKKITIVLTVLIAITIATNAQIPNNGFENWTTIGGYENPTDWNTGNSSSSGTFYPATKSTDHYPISIGNYSIRFENNLPLVNGSSYGFAVTENTISSGCIPSFPITGHPTKLCGYYKCFPINGDTIQIGIMMFKNGVWIAGGELITTQTVSNWTSFSIPIYSNTESYTNIDADSATITLAAFYNDTTCGYPYGPFGNSVLYVDNLSFDNLITSLSEQSINTTFGIYPNPAYDIITLNIDNRSNDDLKLNIYNLIGTLVKSEKLKQNQQQVSIDDLGNGIYTVEIKSKDWTRNQKLIIER